MGTLSGICHEPFEKIEVRLEDGSRVIISPDDPMAFLAAVRTVASERGITIEVNCV